MIALSKMIWGGHVDKHLYQSTLKIWVTEFTNCFLIFWNRGSADIEPIHIMKNMHPFQWAYKNNW